MGVFFCVLLALGVVDVLGVGLPFGVAVFFTGIAFEDKAAHAGEPLVECLVFPRFETRRVAFRDSFYIVVPIVPDCFRRMSRGFGIAANRKKEMEGISWTGFFFLLGCFVCFVCFVSGFDRVSKNVILIRLVRVLACRISTYGSHRHADG